MAEQTCLMCARPLPPDRRPRWLRILFARNPVPVCDPPSEECYREFASRNGIVLTEGEIRGLVRNANRHAGRR